MSYIGSLPKTVAFAAALVIAFAGEMLPQFDVSSVTCEMMVVDDERRYDRSCCSLDSSEVTNNE